MNLSGDLLLYFDGACEPINPGGVATYGWILRDNGSVAAIGKGVARRGEGATNNVAEYSALGYALRYLSDAGWKGKLTMRGDSQLVVNQMNLSWACNKEHLQKLRQRCFELLQEICPGKTYRLEWIPREKNEEADALSRSAYVQATGQAFPERRKKWRR